MKNNKLAILGYGLVLSLSAAACGESGNTPPPADSGEAESSDDNSTTGNESMETGEETDSMDTTGDGDGDGCHAQIDGGTANGEFCEENGDCLSNFCMGISDAPHDPNSVCEPAPTTCVTRVVGQVLEFGTGQPVAGVNLRVVGALGAAVNPVGATAHAEGTTDDNGQYDLTTESVCSG